MTSLEMLVPQKRTKTISLLLGRAMSIFFGQLNYTTIRDSTIQEHYDMIVN